MREPHNPNPNQNPGDDRPHKPPSTWKSMESAGGFKYPNPPESVNPDSATLREQWRFAIKQYSRWYSHAWGTAILAGLSFFALGWLVKGSNPLPSLSAPGHHSSSSSDSADQD